VTKREEREEYKAEIQLIKVIGKENEKIMIRGGKLRSHKEKKKKKKKKRRKAVMCSISMLPASHPHLIITVIK
jgi:hypothetical protein